MATSGNTIALALEIDDKGTATIKNFAGQYEAAMNKVKASTTAVGSVMQRLGGFSSSVGARFSGLIRTLTSLKSLLLGGLGIYSITSVLKDFVAESNNADRATVGLITSLKATGRYTAEYAKKLFDLSSAYQATSTFGDEAIQDTMKMLATFKKISDDQIPRATRAIMDISTLMGTDMASAARLVGRASEGMAEGLSRVGIIIDDDVAKSGDFTKILDAIEAKVHGQSEELRKTGYGGLVAFGNIVGDVKEKLGDLIKSAIYPFVEAMIDGVNDINNNLAAFAANDDFEQRIISIQEKMRDWAVVALESVLKIKQSIAGLVYWIEQHPTIVEMGIVGYFLWGKKGIAGAAGVGVLANSLDRMKATWKGVMSGKVGLWDWILMDREEAEKTIADMNVYVKKSADEIDRLAASGTISAQSARELKEELQGISSVDLDTLTAQPDMFDNLVQGLIDKLNNMKLVAGKSGIDVGKSIGEGISGGVGEAVEDTTDKIKEMAESVYAAELTPDMQQALDDYYTAQEKVSDRIMELKSSETDYQLYLLDKEIKAYTEAGIEKTKLDELYQREREKIFSAETEIKEQEIEKQEDRFKDAAETMRDSLRDLFMNASEGDFSNFFDSVQRKLQSFLANIAASMAANTVGKMVGLGEVVPGMGSLQDVGGLFKGKTSTADVMPGSPYAGESAANAAGAAGSMAGAAGSMAGGSLGTTLGAVSIAASIGSGISEAIASKKEKNEQKRRKRGEDFVNDLTGWMDKEYESIEQMFSSASSSLFSSKGMYAARKYGGFDVSEWAYTWQKAMGVVRSEAKTAGAVSVGSFRQMQESLKQLMVTSPKMAQELEKMQQKLSEEFGQTLREDVEKGLLSVNDAISKMVRTGMGQLDAQTEIFGDSYNDLLILMDGSISIIDESAEAFNNMRENLDELDKDIADLPAGMEDVKKALEKLSYGTRYLINMTQSFVNVMDDLEKLPDIMQDLNEAIDARDWEQAAKDLYKLQDQALEASSAFMQLANALKYLGALDMASLFGNIAKGLGYIAAAMTVLQFIVDVVQWFKELNTETDLQIDKFELWQKQIDESDIKDVIASITDKLASWNDIVDRDMFGDMKMDLSAMLDDFTYAMMELGRLLKEGAIDYEDYTFAATQAIAAYTVQIKDYFDAILRGFADLSKTIKRSIQDVEGGRTADDVMKDIISTGMELGSIDFLKDPDKWLNAAGRLHDLILERYDIEKRRIEELIADQERIKAAYESVVDTITDMLLDIQTSGANPESAANRLSYFGAEAERLRGLIGSETDAGKRAGYQTELASILTQYLAAAEEAYQRPSPQYQQIYDAVVEELGAIKTDAQEKISLADSEIIRLQVELKTLQQETVDALGTLQTAVGTTTTAIEGARDLYLAELGLMSIGIGSVATNTADTSRKLGDVTRVLSNMEVLFRTRFPVASYWATHATGLDRVPYDNYPAMLHKGESVVRARETGSGAPVNISINVSGGGASGRQIADELEKEIKWGRLGTVIQQRVRKAA